LRKKSILVAIILLAVLLNLLSIAFKSISATFDMTVTLMSSSTNVSGYINANTTWTLAGSPYIIMGDVIVVPNVHLTIEPGVVVKFANGADLIIDGALIARGNSTHPITFTSNATIPKVGDWGSIRFRETTIDEACIIDWATIEYASAGVSAFRSSPRIKNSVIQKNTIGVESRSRSFDPIRIYNSTILNNNYGIYNYGEVTVSNSLILSNIYGISIHWSSLEADLTVSESTISKNQYGIKALAANVGTIKVLSSNVSNNNHGINGGENLYISHSIISKNNGTGVTTGSLGVCSIMYSTITENQQNGLYSLESTSNMHFSNIYNNVPYDVYNTISYGVRDVNATNNWWGTTNTTLISEKIYDYYDDYTRSVVYFTPILTSPIMLPVASFAHSPTMPLVGEAVTFNADESQCLDGTIVNYSWDFGDGNVTTVTVPIIKHAYATYGDYIVTLTVTDSHGLNSTTSKMIQIMDDTISPTANAGQDQTVKVGITVNFDAGGSSDNVAIVSYEWDFGDGTTGTGKTTTHKYISPGTYTVTLTVKDAAGNTDTHSITVTVLSVEIFPMWIVGVAIVAIGTAVVATAIWRRRKYRGKH